MKTKLIAVTQPFIDCPDQTTDGAAIKQLTAEEFIVYIARVSNPTNQLNTSTGALLLSYLIRHKHWSPFEHVSCTVEIVTSRAIAAQILRHRSFTFQEFSQRYAQSTSFEPVEFRLQGKTNRQVGDIPVELPADLQEQVSELQAKSQTVYNSLINVGVAKECARMVLPLNTQTTIYMTGTLRSWIHYFDLRCSADTQKEHREIACSIRDTMKPVFPVTFKTLETLRSP